MKDWLRIYGTTVGAIALAAALTAPFAILGLSTLFGGIDDAAMRDALSIGGGGVQDGNTRGSVGFLIGIGFTLPALLATMV